MAFFFWLAALLSALIVHTVKVWSRLRHVPGPPWVFLSKLWQLVTHIRGNWYLELKSLGDKHGMDAPAHLISLYTDEGKATFSVLGPIRSSRPTWT